MAAVIKFRLFIDEPFKSYVSKQKVSCQKGGINSAFSLDERRDGKFTLWFRDTEDGSTDIAGRYNSKEEAEKAAGELAEELGYVFVN